MNRSIFYEDWRDCLRAHYLHVIRTNDTNNEASLYTVLRDTGFSDDEIAEMRGVSPTAAFSMAAGEDVAEPAFQEPDQAPADSEVTFSEEVPTLEASAVPEPIPEPLIAADEPAPTLMGSPPPTVNHAPASASRPMRQQSLFDGF